ncbi:Smr/MutS family protein [Amorphus orientalis]|uniref:DNA-nicking Smr family endonuclease n=1 Tax=Amorphus orientalis TaxID=649198 RepID=A0AAE3VJX3_9HYPH|nr:Smr/MutS family protein [Amorphus orientalis]MDQ0313719.1 DNA-nicking Smr family endonuclease [Amorphus orientalis]
MAVRRRRGPRRLSDEERALWSKVAESVMPLRPEKSLDPQEPAPPADDLSGPDPRTAPKAPVRKVAAVPQAPPAPRHRSSRPAPIERRTLQKIARGALPIDGRLDMHGMRQQAAHGALRAFLISAQARGGRIVLIITGKGRSGDEEAGVLRRQLPHWLEASDLRPLIVGMAVAHRGHGGDGAFYVQLRRRPGPDR